MAYKIISLIMIFIGNFWGVFPVIATFINLPFKMIFGTTSKLHGNKKLYWIGHLLLVSLMFFLWSKITSAPPTFVLILTLIVSTFLSMRTSEEERMALSESQIQESINSKSAFIWNVIIVYVIGLVFGKIEFQWW